MPRLYIENIDSVGLVDDGDNPEAKVSFWKRRRKTTPPPVVPSIIETPGPDRAPPNVEKHMPEHDLSALDDADRTAIEKTIADGVAAAVRVTELEAQVAELTPAPNPVDDADPELRAEFAKRDDKIAKLEALVAASDDKAATAEYTELAKAHPRSFTDEAEAAGFLKTLGASNRPALDFLLGKLGAVEKIAAESKIFKELGSGDAGSAKTQIEVLAAEAIASNPDLSPQSARELVRKGHPDLKRAEAEETR